MTLIRRLILAAALLAGLAPVMAQVPPPVPALPDTERRTSYSLTASTCACSVGFQLYGDSTDYQDWIEVFINGVQAAYNDPAVGWSIASPTGPLATIPRPITDAVLTFNSVQTGTVQIVGARRPRRVSQFNENAGVPARNLNQALTDIIAMLREDWDKINDVTGRAVLAPPGETLNILTSAANRANQGACFDSGGNLIPCVSIPSSTFSAGNGIAFTGTNPTVIKNNIQATSPIVITGTNPLMIACPSCTVTSTPNFAFLPSRANAATQNLSAFTVVQTGGYATPGDGGGATFQNVGSAAFLDQYVIQSQFSITAGTGYTNGTYKQVGFANGCAGGVTVSGGIVTAISIDVPCPGLAVGANLPIPQSQVGGTGTGASITVTAVTAAGASFIDSAGNHWQIVVDAGNYPNLRQFGGVLNWAGSDGSATNDRPALISMLAFASVPSSSGSANVFGGVALVNKGASLICGGVASANATVVIPQGVKLEGMGELGGTNLVQCSAESSGNHFIQLCSAIATRGQIGCKISKMSLTMQGSANSTISALYSASGQQFPLAENLYINPGLRACLFYELGIGGAANAIFNNIDCEGSPSSPNNRVTVAASVGSTQIVLHNWVIETSGAFSGTGIALLGGSAIIDNVNFEDIATGVTVNNILPSSIMNVTSGPNCTTIVSLTASNPNGVTLVGNLTGGSCTTTVSNGHSGGSNVTGNVMVPRIFSP